MKYIRKSICSLALVLFTITIVLNFTLLNKNYIYNSLENDKVYKEITTIVKDQVKDNIDENIPFISNYSQNIVDELITETIIKNQMNHIIDEIYNNKNITIDTKVLTNDFNNNIQSILEKNNITFLDETRIKNLISETVETLVGQINLDEYNNTVSKIYNPINNSITITMYITGFILLLSIIYMIIKRNIYELDYMLISGIVLLLFGNLIGFVLSNIINTDITFVSNVINNTKSYIVTLLNIASIVYILIGGFIRFKLKKLITRGR